MPNTHLLSQISIGAIPAVDSTLKVCAASLQTSMMTQIITAKEFLESLLTDGCPVTALPINRFMDTRVRLLKVEELRQYMDPLETVAEFDNWTLQKFHQFVNSTLEHQRFLEIGVNLKKLLELAEHFSYLSELKSAIAAVVIHLENRVRTIHDNVTEAICLSADGVDKLLENLKRLEDATSQLQPYLSLDCKALMESTVVDVEMAVDAVYQCLVDLLRNPPVLMDQKHVEHFQTLKALAACKDLALFLERNSAKPLEETQSILPAKLYQKVVLASMESAKRVMEQLKVVCQSSSALDSSSERFISTVKGNSQRRICIFLVDLVSVSVSWFRTFFSQLLSFRAIGQFCDAIHRA